MNRRSPTLLTAVRSIFRPPLTAFWLSALLWLVIAFALRLFL